VCRYLGVWLNQKMRGNVKVSRCLAGSEDERECERYLGVWLDWKMRGSVKVERVREGLRSGQGLSG